MNPEKVTGHLIVLMAPSGSGKGSVIAGLGNLADKLYFLKTLTSRAPREGVEENPKYNFVSRDEFEKKIQEDAFVEWAEFGGNLYGTLKSEIIEALEQGKVAFKEMELQGIEQMRALIPEEHMTVIYLDAGSWDSLERRITARAAIDPDELALRKERYGEELKARDVADVVIKNHDGMLESAREDFTKTFQNIIDEVTR